MSWMLALSAAGFIATSTFGASPGVRMSWSEMWTWNDDTPAIVPAGARISAGKFGQRREVVAEGGADVGEPIACELHAVAGVAGEPDDHPVQRLRAASRGCLCRHCRVFHFRHVVGAGSDFRFPRSYFRARVGPERPRISHVDHVGAHSVTGRRGGRARDRPVRSSAARRRRSRAGARDSASTSVRAPLPPVAVRKKRRRTRPTTSTSSSVASVSIHAGGSHTVTGTDVLLDRRLRRWCARRALRYGDRT